MHVLLSRGAVCEYELVLEKLLIYTKSVKYLSTQVHEMRILCSKEDPVATGNGGVVLATGGRSKRSVPQREPTHTDRPGATRLAQAH